METHEIAGSRLLEPHSGMAAWASIYAQKWPGKPHLIYFMRASELMRLAIPSIDYITWKGKRQ